MYQRLNLPAILLPLVLILSWVTFRPALTGPFFFDDFAHLPKLAGNGDGIDTPAEVLRLVFPTHGGSGRTLSYLALLIDDNAWPTVPSQFKRTNLLLHLLNGVLVFTLVRSLTGLIRSTGRRGPNPDWVALLAMALWLLHPIQLSPTMMVIQRMTLLGGTFSLLALLAYLRGRRLAAERPGAGYAWLVLGFGAALILGVMSKESALMTVTYVVALEATVLGGSDPRRPPYWGAWAAMFLVLPLLLTIGYVTAVWPTMAEAYRTRDFTLADRLLTEGRVLVDYVQGVLLPSIIQSGPFRDDYLPSRGLLDPPATLVALATIAAMTALALSRRRAWPLFSFAVLWFLFGHLLEATVLPLELYFEHRNYLPMLGPFFAVAYAALALPPRAKRLAAGGLVGFLALEAGVTYASAQVWGSQAKIATLWSAEHPGSVRAQLVAIQYWAARDDPDRLRHQFNQAIAANPLNASYYLLRFSLQRCGGPALAYLGGDGLADLDRVVPSARFDYASLENIDWLMRHREDQRCRISGDEMQHIFDLYLANPAFTERFDSRKTLYSNLARLRQQLGDLDGTIRALDRVYDAQPSFDTPLMQAYLLATAGLFDEAMRYLNLGAATPATAPYERLEKGPRVAEYRSIVARMRDEAEGDAKRQPNGPPEQPVQVDPAPDSSAPRLQR